MRPMATANIGAKASMKKVAAGSRRVRLAWTVAIVLKAFTRTSPLASRDRWGAGHGDRDAALRGDRADQSGDGVEGDDAAVVDDRDPVAEPLGLLHEVRAHHA